MGLSSKWVVLWSLWAARLVRQPTVPVLVSNGWLQGFLDPTGTQVQYYGVPYATVPHRFQDPGPEPKWDGIFKAVNEHIRCSQRFSTNFLSGSEDCLNLNVYVPLKDPPNPLPVMVFFHGGGFRDGSGSPYIYGPEYLIQHEVILVTLNYRLEILGFLCLGIKEAPGNVGLKDQVAALKWIKKNIRVFGGDPNNVTIFGESAGSASVFYHLLSPMSTGLFQRAIMQSGSAISPWALQFEPLKLAYSFAQQMGYNTTDPKELYNIFVDKPWEKLLSTRVPRTRGDIILSENVFVPCIENKIPNVEQFLPDTPYDLIVSGRYHKVPIMLGYNNAEGYMFAARENDTAVRDMNFYNALPRDLEFPTEEEKIATAMKLKNLYMGEEEISKKTMVKFSFYEGDSSIVYPVIASTELLMKTSSEPVYCYKFCYDGWLNVMKALYGFRAPGATHADDLFYVFRPKLYLINSIYERDFVKKVTKLWTNFAKYSDPTPDTSLIHLRWPPVTKADPRVLVIDQNFTTAPLWDDERMLFWNATYTKYRRKH